MGRSHDCDHLIPDLSGAIWKVDAEPGQALAEACAWVYIAWH